MSMLPDQVLGAV